MLKFFILFSIVVASYANTYVVIDIAQGITKKEYNEVGQLTNPDRKSERDIYSHEENVYLYSFNEKNALSKEFTYQQRNKNENGYKSAKKEFNNFFSQVKKHGVKKRKSVSSNIIFLVDTSGSMKKNNVMQDVKSTIKYLINAKSKKSQVAIVTFDGKKNMQEAKRAKILSGFESSKSKLLATVDTIKPSKYDTFLGSGLQRVSSLLSSVDSKNTLVLLFTDGKAVDDYDKALKSIEKFKSEGIKLKVVAVGGADVDMLKSFSTSGYVFNATSSDLKGMAYGMSVGNDELFLRLNNFLENNPALTSDDRVIIYSSMMNVDAQSDFFIVPNLASQSFYDEMKKINKNRNVDLKFNGAKVYVRLLGKMSASEVNNLKIFYKRFFKDSGADLKFFANSQLSQVKLK